MKYLKFLALGLLFGVVLSKAEVVSWYRIYEMFRLQSFHMYGIIGSAVIIGALLVFFIKRSNMKSMKGEVIQIAPKDKGVVRYLAGGTLFGLGWALTGACPGPMFILVGQGFMAIGVVIAAAILGTLFYGVIRKHLPH